MRFKLILFTFSISNHFYRCRSQNPLDNYILSHYHSYKDYQDTPREFLFWQILGNLLQSKDDQSFGTESESIRKKSFSSYSRAITLAPNGPLPLELELERLLRKMRNKDAYSHLYNLFKTRLTEHDKALSLVYHAESLFLEDNYNASASLLKEAIRINPAHFSTYFFMLKIYRKLSGSSTDLFRVLYGELTLILKNIGINSTDVHIRSLDVDGESKSLPGVFQNFSMEVEDLKNIGDEFLAAISEVRNLK